MPSPVPVGSTRLSASSSSSLNGNGNVNVSGNGNGSGNGKKDRPCDACRRRKMRCHPTPNPNACVLCQSHARSCTFVEEAPRKKRRRVGDDLKGGEVGSSLGTTSGNVVQGDLPVNDYNSLPGPSLLKRTLGHQNRQYTSFLGPTQEYDADILNLAAFNSTGEEDSNQLGTFRRASNRNSTLLNSSSGQYADVEVGETPNTFFKIKSDTQAEIAWEMTHLDRIEKVVAPHGPALVGIYFRIVHPSFPILHKKVFLEKHGRSYRELTPLGLIAVYILALNWWSYSLELASLKKPDVEELERMVPKLLAECYRRPKISDLQAGLVLSQRPEHESWALTAQLLAMAQNLGIHADCSDWKIPDWERGVRKRVAWALYAQDKWGSLIHGRPSHILESNWDVRRLEVQDFPETSIDDNDMEGSAEVEKGRLIFVHLILLTEILTDVLDTFFTLKEIRRKQTTLEALEKAKPLQIRLKFWYTNLPAQLSMDETKSRKLSSTGYLHLAYLAVEVSLHRAIMRSYNGGSTDFEVRRITRSAAEERLTSAVNFLKRLRPQHLQSFWYFASKLNIALIGTFGAVLWATSTTKEEAEECKSQLGDYLWTLRISSNGADFMRHAVQLLDATTAFLSDKPIPRVLNQGSISGSEKLGSDTVDLQLVRGVQHQGDQNGLVSGSTPFAEFDWDESAFQNSMSPPISATWFQDFSNTTDQQGF